MGALGEGPVPEPELRKVWDVVMSVLGGAEGPGQGSDDMFHKEYVAARGEALLLPGRLAATDGEQVPPSSVRSDDQPRTPRLSPAQV